MEKTEELLRRIELECQEIVALNFNAFTSKRVTKEIMEMIDEYRAEHEDSTV